MSTIAELKAEFERERAKGADRADIRKLARLTEQVEAMRAEDAAKLNRMFDRSDELRARRAADEADTVWHVCRWAPVGVDRVALRWSQGKRGGTGRYDRFEMTGPCPHCGTREHRKVQP